MKTTKHKKKYPVPVANKVFHVNRAWLRSMPVCGQSKRAEDLVRFDRDGRDCAS